MNISKKQREKDLEETYERCKQHSNYSLFDEIENDKIKSTILSIVIIIAEILVLFIIVANFSHLKYILTLLLVIIVLKYF